MNNATRLCAAGLVWLAAMLCRPAAAQEGDPPLPLCSQQAPVQSLTRTVIPGYFEIIYDVSNKQLTWKDQSGRPRTTSPIVINYNSVFAPITFAKERILVTVCNARFTTSATTVVATTPIPENTLDVRGSTPAASTVTGSTVSLPSSLSLIAPATPPAVTAAAAPKSADDYAQMAVAYYASFQQLQKELAAVWCSATRLDMPDDSNDCTPDSVIKIYNRAKGIQSNATLTAAVPTDQAGFDQVSATTKRLVDDMNTLSATVAAGDYLNRLVTLSGKYGELLAAKKKIDGYTAPDSATIAPLVTEAQNNYQQADNLLQSATPAVRTAADSVQKAAKSVLHAAGDLQVEKDFANNVGEARTAQQSAESALLSVPAGSTFDQLRRTAAAVEASAEKIFKAAKDFGAAKPPTFAEINAVLATYLSAGITFQSIVSNFVPQTLGDAIDKLGKKLVDLHTVAGDVFQRINEWRRRSAVSVTMAVTPPGGNAILNVYITLKDAYTPFTFGAPPKKDSGDAKDAKASAGTVTSAAATGPASDQHEVRRVLVEVHRKADANLVGAIIGSTIPARNYALAPGAAITGGTSPVTPYYVYQSQNDRVQIQGIAGINWYPGGRDFYPGYFRGSRRWIPGVLFGTSVTATGNFIGGLDFEPVNGFDLILGGEVGPVTTLAPGVPLGPFTTPNPSVYFASGDTIPTKQKLTGGFVFGIGFDLSVFNSIFSSGSSPSSSSTTTSSAASPTASQGH